MGVGVGGWVSVGGGDGLGVDVAVFVGDAIGGGMGVAEGGGVPAKPLVVRAWDGGDPAGFRAASWPRLQAPRTRRPNKMSSQVIKGWLDAALSGRVSLRINDPF